MKVSEVVLALARERGAAGLSYPEALEALPDWPKKHVRSALHNLTRGGHLRCEPGPGNGRGRLPGRYFVRPVRLQRKSGRPIKMENLPSYPVSSPWTLAGGVDMPWPPKFDGGRVFLHMAREDFMQEVA